MAAKLLLGLDISTTATKALVINQDGEVQGVGVAEYSFETTKPLWSEQDPALWWEGTQLAINRACQQAGIATNEINAVGLTGQMHGLVLLDADGAVLRKSILWNDQRTQLQCDAIHEQFGKLNFIQITGNIALTGFTAPKILWVKENEPDVYDRIAHILLPKDYIRFMLTGAYAMDKADGAGTVLMDLEKRDWSREVLEALDIPKNWMPPLYEGPQITGYVTSEAGARTGLKTGIPVVAGGGDQAAQAIGVGAVREGVVALTLGTSGVVFTSTDRPYIESEGRLHAFCHAIPEKWHLMGVMLSAGGSLRWFRDTFMPGVDYDVLLAPAADLEPGADGLVFLPYLTGERTPHPNPLARGSFVGLTVRHNVVHCTRAVLEGVAFGLRDSFELIQSVGIKEINQVRVSGGGARSPLWLQILADVFNTQLVTVNTTEGAAYGSALLAGVGTGCWSGVEEACDAVITVTDRTHPREARVEEYDQVYDIYKSLYPRLQMIFQKLSAL